MVFSLALKDDTVELCLQSCGSERCFPIIYFEILSDQAVKWLSLVSIKSEQVI